MLGRVTRITFEAVKLSANKKGKCGCGIHRTRSTTFQQTINPFNKNKKGEPKTYDEIMVELQAQAAAWKQEPVTCKVCE